MRNKITIEIILCGAIIGLLIIGTHYRNEVWQSGESLWADAFKKSPEKSRPRINYAAQMIKLGRFEEAIYELNEVLRRDPQSAEAMNNLAMIYTFQGRYDDAEKLYFSAIRIAPKSEKGEGIAASAHNNLGVIMVKKGAFNEAVIQFEKAIKINPDFKEAKENLDIIERVIAQKSK
jgi:tetratricopeptide (TPR) repeat protein